MPFQQDFLYCFYRTERIQIVFRSDNGLEGNTLSGQNLACLRFAAITVRMTDEDKKTKNYQCFKTRQFDCLGIDHNSFT